MSERDSKEYPAWKLYLKYFMVFSIFPFLYFVGIIENDKDIVKMEKVMDSLLNIDSEAFGFLSMTICLCYHKGLNQ